MYDHHQAVHYDAADVKMFWPCLQRCPQAKANREVEPFISYLLLQTIYFEKYSLRLEQQVGKFTTDHLPGETNGRRLNITLTNRQELHWGNWVHMLRGE